MFYICLRLCCCHGSARLGTEHAAGPAYLVPAPLQQGVQLRRGCGIHSCPWQPPPPDDYAGPAELCERPMLPGSLNCSDPAGAGSSTRKQPLQLLLHPAPEKSCPSCWGEPGVCLWWEPVLGCPRQSPGDTPGASGPACVCVTADTAEATRPPLLPAPMPAGIPLRAPALPARGLAGCRSEIPHWDGHMAPRAGAVARARPGLATPGCLLTPLACLSSLLWAPISKILCDLKAT